MAEFPQIPFAEVSDLEGRWRKLSDSEQTIAETLLTDASIMVRNRASDAKHTDADTLRMVVCEMVKRAMAGPMAAGMGVNSIQQGAGPYQQTAQFTNPLGDLYLSKSDLKDLGSGKQVAFTIELGGKGVHG